MTLLLGVYPSLALDVIGPSVENLVHHYDLAVGQTLSDTAIAASH
jgi:NADH-quinone oxidoreductase subunit M